MVSKGILTHSSAKAVSILFKGDGRGYRLHFLFKMNYKFLIISCGQVRCSTSLECSSNHLLTTLTALISALPF